MVLAVAVDPFIQQLVQPVDCSVEVSGGNAAAFLPRTNVFDDGYLGNLTTPLDTELERSDKVIESILYAAIFNPGQHPPWQCSTGNCTFQQTYGTIGICSSCEDVSADVTINSTCRHTNSSYTSQQSTSGSDCPAPSRFTVESNITVREDMKLGTKMNSTSSGWPDTVVLADLYAVAFPWDYSRIIRNVSFGFLIGATAMSGGRIDWTTSDRGSGVKPYENPACNSDDSKESWACQGYGAAICSLEPCVKIYNATISAGVLEENLVASSSGTAWGTIYTPDDDYGSYLALIDTHCSAGIQTLSSRDSSVGGRWVPYDFSLADADVERDEDDIIIGFHLPDDVTSLLDNGCLYLMSAISTFSSVQMSLIGMVQGLPSAIAGQVGGSLNIEEMSGFEGPQVVRSIYNWGHTDFDRVQSVAANISDSLTTYIRTHGGSPQVPGSTKFPRGVEGKVYHYATCLQVQWPWLSYPASLVVLTTWFFLMVIEVTRRRGNSVWKASPLAWILRVEGTGNEIVPSSHGSCNNLKDRSTQIAVHLFE